MIQNATCRVVLATLAVSAVACGKVTPADPDAADGSTEPADAAPDGPAAMCTWSAPLQVLRAPDNQFQESAPAVTADKLHMYFTSQNERPASFEATRASATGNWSPQGAILSGGPYAVQDVSADGAEIILVDLQASRLVSAVRDASTGRFATPTPVGLPLASVSISPDRLTLYIAGDGQVQQATRSSTAGAWTTPTTVLTWSDLMYSFVDVSADGQTLLLSGDSGAAMSHWSGTAWSAPAPLRGFNAQAANGELVADDLIYFDVSNDLYYSQCAPAP